MPTATSQYSKAFFEKTLEEDSIQKVYSDLDCFIIPALQNKELSSFLQIPYISLDNKLHVLKELFQKNVAPSILDFLSIIIQYKREREMLSILEKCVHLLEDNLQIKKVVFVTATEVLSSIKTDFEKIIKNFLKCKSIILIHKIDESIIGGYKAFIGNNQIDFSIKSGLQKINKLVLNKL